MARVNISIPDPLYERLDRLRDRVNASKVCASALERELDMIEGRTAISDPEIERLLGRLQGARDRWYQRGRDDARRWAVERATREELWHVAEELEDEDGEDLAHLLRRRHRHVRRLFGDYDFAGAIERWLAEDATGQPEQEAPSFRASPRGRRRDEEEDADDDPDEVLDRRIPPDVDLAAYMEGWRDATHEIWQVVAKALRR